MTAKPRAPERSVTALARRVKRRAMILRKAIEYGLQADAAYSEPVYGAREVRRAALALGEDPHCYQFDLAYARAGGHKAFFEKMEGALLGLGYRVGTQRLVLRRHLEAPPRLSPDSERRLAETVTKLEAEEEEPLNQLAEQDKRKARRDASAASQEAGAE